MIHDTCMDACQPAAEISTSAIDPEWVGERWNEVGTWISRFMKERSGFCFGREFFHRGAENMLVSLPAGLEE
jgi:hypothetical protein